MVPGSEPARLPTWAMDAPLYPLGFSSCPSSGGKDGTSVPVRMGLVYGALNIMK